MSNDVLIEDPEVFQDTIPDRSITTKTKFVELQEGDVGYSYEVLFLPFIKESKEIRIVDPFIRLSYQVDNLLEFCKVLATSRVSKLVLVTSANKDDNEQKHKNELKFEELKKALIKK
jgi:ATP-dependent Lon protease